MKTDPIKKARRDALREAQTWLFERAKMMDDPKAVNILNSAAFEFGTVKLRGLDATLKEQQND